MMVERHSDQRIADADHARFHRVIHLSVVEGSNAAVCSFSIPRDIPV